MQNVLLQLPLPPVRNEVFTEKAFKNVDNFPVAAGGKKHTENKDRWKLKPDKTVYGPLLVKADNNYRGEKPDYSFLE